MIWIGLLVAIALLRIYIDVNRKPRLLSVVTRFIWAVIVALLLTAALSAEDASADAFMKCHRCAWIGICCGDE